MRSVAIEGFWRLMRNSLGSQALGAVMAVPIVGLVGWSAYMSLSSGWLLFGFTRSGMGKSQGNSYPKITESGESFVVQNGGLVLVAGLVSVFRVGGMYNEFWVLQWYPYWGCTNSAGLEYLVMVHGTDGYTFRSVGGPTCKETSFCLAFLFSWSAVVQFSSGAWSFLVSSIG